MGITAEAGIVMLRMQLKDSSIYCPTAGEGQIFAQAVIEQLTLNAH